MSDSLLELRNISKSFPGVLALDNVSFSLRRGEIHAIMGENGAGKSTFIKVITGVHEADAGEIILEGRKVEFKNPRDAQKQSIAAIYQHGTAYPHLSITENIFVGHEQVKGFLKTIDWNSLHRRAEALLRELSCELDPRTTLGGLSVAEKQIVEIAKAISQDARILIMDEPTASLSRKECENLYHTTERLRDSGVSIIFISHRFEDMFRLADRVTVLRDGRYIGAWDVDKISEKELISAMVGREINQIYPAKDCEIGGEIFRAEGFSRTGYFSDVSFGVRKGEILGLFGLVGSGRTDVMQSIFGIHPADAGRIYLDGTEIKIKNPREAISAGIGLLPEDRQHQGLILQWEIYKNITISGLKEFTERSVMKPRTERVKAKTLGEKIALKAQTVFDKVSSLSGGNQQKVVICKLLNLDMKVLILDEPTKGVDVGAKSQIYEIMNDLAAQGYGIVMISSDMPEILGMCDRIIVMHEGRVTGEYKRGEANQETLLAASMNIDERGAAGG